METAPHHGERFAVGRIVAQFGERHGDMRQHFVGFLEIDADQFRIDRLRRGVEHAHRLRRGRRRLGDLDHATQRLLDDVLGFVLPRRNGCFVDRFLYALQGLQGALRLRFQRRVGNQTGILLDGSQLPLQFSLEQRIGRPAFPFLEQRLRLLFLFFELCLDTDAGRRLRRRCGVGYAAEARYRFLRRTDAGGAGLHRTHGRIEVGVAVDQGIEIEAQSGQRLRRGFEVAGQRRVDRIRIAMNARRTHGQRIAGTRLTQHVERAHHLLHGFVERGELGVVRRIAEKTIQHLLDNPQVGLHLADDLIGDQPFLRASRHFIQQRDARRGAQQLAVLHRRQSRRHEFALLAEVLAGRRTRRGETLGHVLQQQQCRGYFQRHHFAHARGIGRQPHADIVNIGGKPGDVGMSQAPGLRDQPGRQRIEIADRRRDGFNAARMTSG